jgi:hypothetical protein
MNFRTPTNAFEGKILGVTVDGFLKVQDRQDAINTYNLKEISFVTS